MIIFSLRVRNDVKASDHIQSDIVRTGDHIQSDNNNNVNAGKDFQSDIVRTGITLQSGIVTKEKYEEIFF